MRNKKQKYHLNEEDKRLFRQSMKDVEPFSHDIVVPVTPTPSARQRHLAQQKKNSALQNNSYFYFSDEYQPLLVLSDPTRYISQPDLTYQLKKLRRGDYHPELFLDLHGLTQQQAKREIAAFIVTCQQQHIQCACIIHGHGKQVLKQQTPLWLAQHPDIIAFHQAPKIYGGDAALLLLLASH